MFIFALHHSSIWKWVETSYSSRFRLLPNTDCFYLDMFICGGEFTYKHLHTKTFTDICITLLLVGNLLGGHGGVYAMRPLITRSSRLMGNICFKSQKVPVQLHDSPTEYTFHSWPNSSSFSRALCTAYVFVFLLRLWLLLYPKAIMMSSKFRTPSGIPRPFAYISRASGSL